MKPLEDFILASARLGELYFDRYLAEQKPIELKASWRKALEFFFSKVFYQGRRDKVSDKFKGIADRVIEEVIGKDPDSPNDSEIASIKHELEKEDKRKYNGKIIISKQLPKEGDRKMVIATLEFCKRIPYHNIVSFSIDSINHINKGSLVSNYNELQEEIHQIGPKVAALYLRDLIQVFSLEESLQQEDLICLQPIDTWVKKIIKSFDPAIESDRELRQWIIDNSKGLGKSSLKVNQGIWALGARADAILLCLFHIVPSFSSYFDQLEPPEVFRPDNG